MDKTVNGKKFELGSLYVAPWNLSGGHLMETYGKPEVIIPSNSLVVVLDVQGSDSDKISSYFSPYNYCLHLLTTNGEIVYIYSTAAGLDYWKTADQAKKNKKF